MSSQSYIYNPTERTLAAAGDGFSCPRLTTAGRTALSLTANDKGMMVYDTTLTDLCIWDGSAWQFVNDSGNTIVSVKDYGAKGDGVTDDTAAFQAAVDSGYYFIFVPSGQYAIASTVTITKTGLTLFGESDYQSRLIGTGTGPIIQIGDSAYNIVEHTTISNISYYGESTFNGICYISVKRAFQTYFYRTRYKFSKKAPTSSIVLLDNKGGTIENPTRLTFRDCYFDGDDYSTVPAGVPTPCAIWNTAGIQVIIDNTHIQDCEIGVKLGVNPAVDINYYNPAFPNDHDFNDFYFLNNSRYQVGSRGYTDTNARAFDIWEGNNVVVSDSTFYLNNNSPVPPLPNQVVARFNSPTFSSFVFNNNLVNFNSISTNAFKVVSTAVVGKLMVSGCSFISGTGYNSLISVDAGGVCNAVIEPDNYFSNPNDYGSAAVQTNGTITAFNLGGASNFTYVQNDAGARTITSFTNGQIGTPYLIEFSIVSGTVSITTGSKLVIDGCNGTISLQNGDSLLVRRSNLSTDNIYYAKLIRNNLRATELNLIATAANPLKITGTATGAAQSLLRILSAAGNTDGFKITLNSASDAIQLLNYYNALVQIGNNNTPRVEIPAGGSFRPVDDNVQNLGGASNRWATVYAGNGTINTSDQNAKDFIEPIPQSWIDAWGDVEYVRFKYRDAIAIKGSGARWHVGVIAQRIKEAFEKRGIDAFEIGLLCFDKWEDEYADETVEVDIVESDGTIGKELRPTGKKVLVKAAGQRYGVRYDEALALECAYLRSKLNA